MKYKQKWSIPPGRPKKKKEKPEDPGLKWTRIVRGMKEKGMIK